MTRILITGATGNTASLVIPMLQQRGVDVRALAHSPAKAAKLREVGVEAFAGEFDDKAVTDKALDGVDTVFLVTPGSEHAATWARSLVDAAKATGVKRIVRLSALRAASDGPTANTRLHAETEKDIVDRGFEYTFLRPNFFMQALLMAGESIAKDGKMYWGMGDARLGMVDVRDIADVAVTVLLDPAHNGQTYEITGPSSITFDDAARSLSAAIDKPVEYVAIPPSAAGEAVRSMMGDWVGQVMQDYSQAYTDGFGDFTTDVVERVTGHPARSIDRFATEVFAPALSS